MNKTTLHDKPIIMGLPDADIISFDNGKIQRCAYEETESYLITKAFVNNRKEYWKICWRIQIVRYQSIYLSPDRFCRGFDYFWRR